MKLILSTVRRPAATLLFAATLVTALPNVAIAQATLRVPSQFATIQAAIDAAPPGATVLIEPGTYTVTNLDPGGREITIRGELGAQQTVLDANLQGRIVHVRNHEGPGLRFVGLTFRRGVPPLNGRGGAMRIDGFATPHIENCVFEQNDSTVGGAAIEVAESAGAELTDCTFSANVGGAFWSETDGDVLLARCTFTQNTASPVLYGDGLFGGTLRLTDCTFEGNTPASDLIRLDDVTCTLLRCTIRNNLVPRNGLRSRQRQPFQALDVLDCSFLDNDCESTVCEVFGSGTGAPHWQPVRFKGCTFADNRLIGGNARCCLWIQQHNCCVDGCTFERNTSSSAFAVARIEGLTSSAGGARFAMTRSRVLDNTTAALSMLLFSGGTATIDNSLFARNQSATGPSVIFVNSATDVTVSHCTFTENTVNTTSGSGGAVEDVPMLTSSIVYGNTPQQIEGTATTASYCDIEGGFPGTGNFDADPLLIGSGPRAFRLGLGSPCVDAGPPGSPTSPLDLDGQPRTLGLATDVGCDESLAQPLPGTDGDLLLTTTLDGQGDPLGAQKAAQTGQRLELQVQSLTGQTVGAWTLVAGELRPTGAPQPGFVLLPGMHLDALSPVFFLMFNSFAIPSPLGGSGLPATGLALSFGVPTGLSGSSVHLQALAIHLTTGTYDASNSHEVVLP